MIRIILALVALSLALAFVGGCKEKVPFESIIDIIGEEDKALPEEEDDKRQESNFPYEFSHDDDFDECKISMHESLDGYDAFVIDNRIDTSSNVPFFFHASRGIDPHNYSDEITIKRLSNGSLCFSWKHLDNMCLAKLDNGKWLTYFDEPLTKDNVMFEARSLLEDVKIIDYSFLQELGVFVFAGYNSRKENLDNKEGDYQQFLDFSIYYARWNGKFWVNASNVIFTLDNGLVATGLFKEAWDIEILDCKMDKKGFPSIAWVMFNDISADDEYFDESQRKWFFLRWTKEGWINLAGQLVHGGIIESGELKIVVYDKSKDEALSDALSYALSSITDFGFGANDEIFFLLGERYYVIYVNGVFKSLNDEELTFTNISIVPEWNGFYADKLILDSNNHPNIASSLYQYHETIRSNGSEVVYAKWDGRQWVNDYGQKATADNVLVRRFVGWAKGVKMVLDSNDYPCLVWQDAVSDSWEIYFARWNGKMWTNAAGEYFTAQNGNVSKNGTNSHYPCLVLDENDNPIVAWSDYVFGKSGPGRECFEFITAVKWDGRGWVDVIGR